MGGYPDFPGLPRNSEYRVRRWNRRSGGWASTSTGRSDRPLKIASPLGAVLIVHDFGTLIRAPLGSAPGVPFITRWRYNSAKSQGIAHTCHQAGHLMSASRCQSPCDKDFPLLIRRLFPFLATACLLCPFVLAQKSKTDDLQIIYDTWTFQQG